MKNGLLDQKETDLHVYVQSAWCAKCNLQFANVKLHVHIVVREIFGSKIFRLLIFVIV